MEKEVKKYKLIIAVVMIFAIVIRLMYVLESQILTIQYDVGNPGKVLNEEEYESLYEIYDEEPYVGRHIHYIMQLYYGDGLANEILGQFYHPPLHHFILANILRVMDNFDVPASVKLETMQFAPLLYSIIILVAVYKILGELGLDEKDKILPMVLMGFLPINIYMAGAINNDTLVLMFSVLSLLYTLKWQKIPSMKNAILLALWLGLGMMTKTSIIVMIIPAVYVYFKELIDQVYKDKKYWKLLIQLLVFAIIVGSLGLWFQFRNLLVGLNTIGIIQPNENLSVAHYSVWERFGFSSILRMSECNLWNNLVFTSINYGLIYGESLVEGLVALSAAVLIIISMCLMCINVKENMVLVITYLMWWIGYLYLNISMPYSCSMCARYMVMPLMIGFIMLSKGMAKEDSKAFKGLIYLCTLAICIFSIVCFVF